MGFSSRKSFKAGPIRITASKSGISYSAGVKGARVTKRADGKVQTTLSVPGTGIRHTSTSSRRPVAQPQGKAAPRHLHVRLVARKGTFRGPAVALTICGYIGTTVVLHPDRVEITRGALRRLVGQQKVTTIPWGDVFDIEVLNPTVAGGVGYVRILTSADREVPVGLDRRAQTKAASKRPGTVIFSNLPGGMSAHQSLVDAVMSCLQG